MKERMPPHRRTAAPPQDAPRGPQVSRRAFALTGLGAGAFSLFGAPLARALAPIAVSGVRLGGSAEATRLVLDLAASPSHSSFNLADPYRIVFDFPDLDWHVAAERMPAPTGLIRGLRAGLFRPGTFRLVLDLSGPAEIARTLSLPPQSGYGWRFVVDLRPTSRDAFMARLGRDPGAPQAAKASEPAVNSRERRAGGIKPVIVLDPGHGGVDPGAIGVNGVYEKHITLAMARQLKARLEKAGRYTVVLTRDRDIFIPLRERVAIARRAHGDLFISLHADSNPNRSTRGLSIYTLSERASDKEAGLLADKENKADIISGMDFSEESPEVTGILIDLAQRESMNLSAQFAALSVGELRRQVRTLDNTHRFAGFAVLKAPDIPSVLLEMGYLSNSEEVRLLQQAGYRDRLAGSMAHAVDRYFDQTQSAQRP
ncbi:MAG: N-acetylmuramoyl-L-alanine amidase [Rhodospirillaceae bacterium]